MSKLEDIYDKLSRYIDANFKNLHTSAEVSKVNAIERFKTVFMELKDGKISVDSSMPIYKFNNRANVGDNIKLSGRLALRGSRVRFIINDLTKQGKGKVVKELEKNYKILEKKGYIKAENKKDIKRDYQKIGMVTSCHAAGFKDFIDTIRNRKNDVQVRVYDTRVQGAYAGKQITKAIKLANKDKWADVIVVTRGGGSKDDLSCFNDLDVCLAIGESKLPIVTGIGHQIDNFLADEVADKSFITPTATAEGITINYKSDLPELQRLRETLRYRLKNRLEKTIEKIINYQRIASSNQILGQLDTMNMISNQMRGQLINNLKNQKEKIRNYEVSLSKPELLNQLDRLEENFKKIEDSKKIAFDHRLREAENKLENFRIRIENGKTNGTILKNSKGLSVETIENLKKELKKNDNFILYLQGSSIKVSIKLNE